MHHIPLWAWVIVGTLAYIAMGSMIGTMMRTPNDDDIAREIKRDDELRAARAARAAERASRLA